MYEFLKCLYFILFFYSETMPSFYVHSCDMGSVWIFSVYCCNQIWTVIRELNLVIFCHIRKNDDFWRILYSWRIINSTISTLTWYIDYMFDRMDVSPFCMSFITNAMFLSRWRCSLKFIEIIEETCFKTSECFQMATNKGLILVT